MQNFSNKSKNQIKASLKSVLNQCMVAKIIGQLYTGNISKITEVVRQWKGAFFTAKQKDGAI